MHPKIFVSALDSTKDYASMAEKYGYELCGPVAGPHSGNPEEILLAMKECDAGIIDCDFDTVEPYCDPSFEMGYLYGLGKPVVGTLSDTRSCAEKYPGEIHRDVRRNRTWCDENGLSLDSSCLNLMLEFGSRVVHGDIEEGFRDLRSNGMPEVCDGGDEPGFGLRGNRLCYLAGFEMFYEDGCGLGRKSEEASRKYGIDGLFPLEPVPGEYGYAEYEPKDESIYESRKKLFLHDLKVMRSCDIIIANLSLFRDGHQPDSGTVFECGAMYALGKHCFGFYEDDTPDGLGPVTKYCMKLAHGPIEAGCRLAAESLGY
ncbi:MAG: nucleoside 2-deoxyribosyltransferase [Oscillospiraceae bacterium]|jgi:nucleoside 2-deoxyribosyltransferase